MKTSVASTLFLNTILLSLGRAQFLAALNISPAGGHNHGLVRARSLNARAAAANAAFPTGWTAQGCYSDNVNGRALAAGGYVDNTAMTQESCATYCANNGFQYAGVEYSQECYCDNTIGNGGALAASGDCSMKCTGNPGETCGGPNRLNIFYSNAASASRASPAVVPSYGNWASVGCYSEGNGGRTLGMGMGVTGGNLNMTVENCVSACQTAGYTLAGVEYADECYCGNSFQLGGTPASSGCTMLCAGNKLEYCGGPNRLNAYSYSGNGPTSSASGSTTASATAPPASTSSAATATTTTTTAQQTGPATVQTYGQWQSLGCYSEGTNGRTLTQGTAVVGGSQNMTVENCLDACSAGGYSLAGVEYSGECYCGTAFRNNGAPATSGCTMTCNGNQNEFCGGPNRLNAYQFIGTPGAPAAPGNNNNNAGGGAAAAAPASTGGPAPVTSGLAPWQYVACYTEGQQVRAMSIQAPDSNTLTVQSCISFCSGQNYTVAGMEYASQCFCDNLLRSGPSVAPASDCSTACSGDSTQACGAGGRLSVYSTSPTVQVLPVPTAKTTGLPGSWEYLGCYQEPVAPAPRLFLHQIIDTVNMSINNCLNLCSTYGYPAGGVEYGHECWCGDISNIATSPGQVADAQCEDPCPGDPISLCGSGNLLSLYTWNGTALYNWETPAVPGRYEFLVGGPIVPLVATLGINNKVTILEKLGSGPPNSTHAYELDYTLASDATKSFREMHVKTDVFCSASLILPDKAGRQLNVGGWAEESTFGVRLYSPDGALGQNGTNDWEENVDELRLQVTRWYPGAMVMSNGSVVVVGGERGANDIAEPTLEVVPQIPGGSTLLYLDFLAQTDPNNLYPFLYVLPSGGIFILYYNQARVLDPVTFDTTTLLPTIPGGVGYAAGRTYPYAGATVLLPLTFPYTDPATVLSCGGSAQGGAQALDNCVSVQPEVTGSQWTIERMPFKRVMPCIAPLPDGTYLIVNGAQAGVAGFGLAENPILTALLYDPSKALGSRISILNTTIVGRLYHSEAVLLHDGRVLISGSDPLTTVYNPDGSVNEAASYPEEYRMEVYYPPYLCDGRVQPTYTIVNTDWTYGQTYTITVSLAQGPTSAMRVSLLAAVSSTHGNNFGARTLFPQFSCAGTRCAITAPPNNRVAPPGWFQLFVLDGPTPSHSQWVRIGGDPASLGTWPAYSDFTTPGV